MLAICSSLPRIMPILTTCFTSVTYPSPHLIFNSGVNPGTMDDGVDVNVIDEAGDSKFQGNYRVDRNRLNLI